MNVLVWTSEMVRDLMLLHQEKVPFTQIAAKLSAKTGVTITKNACIGKARRLGLPVRHPVDPERVLKQPRRKMIRLPRRVDAPIEPEPEPVVETLPGISIQQHTLRTCRWPLGKVQDRPPYRYCGCRCSVERPYCAEHTAVSRGGSVVLRRIA
jgi:hypothetical protein